LRREWGNYLISFIFGSNGLRYNDAILFWLGEVSMNRVEAFKAALAERRAVKLIAGIANFNLENILSVARATEAAGAHAIDVAARPEIIQALPLLASIRLNWRKPLPLARILRNWATLMHCTIKVYSSVRKKS
jgi:hypothetical protein